ncbi:hypothetical protein L917_01060 [Plasmopara halstedii]|uniref:FYVE-type domain-containing protein n=1 Tax=Plasmopara halstedii TaxID=4781 RepID=A0A0P1ABP7_PLAHL|nr:hypothetical protein L917_01060 [Plasmopara halstedii]CEG37926.1 hypothetical protein L917_01060 [Plasmopara halstedii]|eukprot:XP_024574295.1 hypothetical protein L917_01060 [Plasmopara halstedii]
MNHTHSHSGFPLRSDFFRSLPLAKFKNDKLYRLAKANAFTCLNQSFNDQWRYVPPEKDGTQIRKDTSNLAASYRLVRAATVLRCQEHEVNQIVANTNSESWREFVRKCFGKYYVDTLILHNVTKPNDIDTVKQPEHGNSQPEGSGSEESPGCLKKDCIGSDGRRGSLRTIGVDHNVEAKLHKNLDIGSSINLIDRVSSECSSSNAEELLKEEAAAAVDGLGEQAEELLTVKWAAFETGISGKRDVCLVDYLSLAYVPNSEPRQRVHVWCFTSAEGERVGCMELKDTHHVTRTTLTKLGLFWHKVSDDETEVIVCGSFPSKHAHMVSAIQLNCLNQLQGIVEDLRMSSQLYIQRATWVKNSERTTCNLCTRNFHALRRKHHCRRCGEVVCSDCSTVETVDLPAIGYSKLRLCKVCSIRARTTPLKQVAKTNVFDHLVRVRRLSDVGSSNATSSFTRSSCTENNQASHHEDSQGNSELIISGYINRTQSSSTTNSASNNCQGISSCGSHSKNSISMQNPETSDTNELTMHSMTASLDSPFEAYDDFINESCLKTQLCAMEHKKRSNGGNSNMFDLLCELACQTLDCPVASVSIVDDMDNLICSAVGFEVNSALDGELSVFINKIMGSTPTIVLDASVDKQALKFFSLGSLPHIRFFAGCPIYSRTGRKLGYVCVADFAKRDSLGASCAFTMERLATLAVTTMERDVLNKTDENKNARLNNIKEADFTKRATTHTPLHPAILSDRINGIGMSGKGQDNVESKAHSEALVRHVCEIVEDETPPITTPSTVNIRRVAGDRSADYYETQERMRKLLIKSYHTQQQLAISGSL